MLPHFKEQLRAVSRSPCVGCLSKRTHVRASGVYQLFTQRERRLIVVWWHKSRLSVVAAGGGTSHALVCTRSPLTFQSQHINTALTCPRPLPEPRSCYTKTRTDPVFHCLKKKKKINKHPVVPMGGDVHSCLALFVDYVFN